MTYKAKKILLANKSRCFVMYVGMFLQRLGYKVIPAETGTEALKLLNMFTPDIVLLDSELASVDSYSVFKQLKGDRSTSGVSIIMVSNDPQKRQTYQKEGCKCFISTPVKLSELHEVIEGYSGSKKRKFLRAPFKQKVSLTLNGSIHHCYAEDLSEGGIYVRMLDPATVGEEVLVSMPLGKKSLHVSGRVAYSKGLFGEGYRIPAGIAVEFTGLSDEEYSVIKSFTIELLARDILDEQEEEIIRV